MERNVPLHGWHTFVHISSPFGGSKPLRHYLLNLLLAQLRHAQNPEGFVCRTTEHRVISDERHAFVDILSAFCGSKPLLTLLLQSTAQHPQYVAWPRAPSSRMFECRPGDFPSSDP